MQKLQFSTKKNKKTCKRQKYTTIQANSHKLLLLYTIAIGAEK